MPGAIDFNILFNSVFGVMMSVMGFLLINVYQDVKYLVRREGEARVMMENVERRVGANELRLAELGKAIQKLEVKAGM